MHKCVLVLTLLAAMATAQVLKQGDCPPAFVSQNCNQMCRKDSDCLGQEKCCTTSCNGAVCVRPVTMRRPNTNERKSGRCPVKRTGAWVCSNTCSYDSDCRGKNKCCRGRCPGSMVCQKPEE